MRMERATGCWLTAMLLLFAGLVAGEEGGGGGRYNQQGELPPDRLSPPVQELCDQYFDWKVKDMPEFATFVGIHDYDHLLDEVSLEAYEERLSQVKSFLESATELQPGLVLHVDEVNIEVLIGELQTYIDGFPFKSFEMPLNYMEGPQTDLLRVLAWMPLESYSNYLTLLRRLGRVQTQLQQIEELLRDSVKTAMLPHATSMNRVPEEMDAFIVSDPEDSPIFQQFFMNFTANVTEEQALDLQDRARTVIEEQISPGFAQLRDFLNSTEYATREDIAITSLPDGDLLYAQLIKFHTGDTAKPWRIHRKGLDEVERINSLMQEIVYELGYNMSCEEFSDMIRADPANFYDTADEVMKGFETVVYDLIIPALPLAFINIPKAELILEEAPTPDKPGAYYLGGSFDGSRPGVFYVNTYDPHSQPKYEMMTLSLHEGNPGHHLQGSHSIESETVPFFRRVTDDRNYAQAPSRFPLRSYYIEGWGLYAEDIGFDLQLYDDPLERYGHYSYEMFRACRLVVDTGIHALGWTKTEAVDYMKQNTALTPMTIENEVNRYITWPGQALGYKWGELQFREFRASAEERLGDLFDLREFHDVLLESVGPMTLVEAEVDEWVDSVLSQNPNKL